MRSLALPACCASGSKPGHLARFCFRQRGAPAGAAAGGSGAGMPWICQQPADADRPAVAGQRWPGLAGAAQHAPPAVGDLHAGLRSVGRLYRSCSPELRHAIQVGQRDGRAAQQLVGGRDSLSVPPGEIAGAWLIRQNLADLFIGYAHYGPALAACDDLRTLTIPAPWNIRCDYQLARLRADPPRWPCIALSSATLVRGISGRRVLCRSATQRKPRRQQRERGGGMADQAYRQAVRLPEMRFAQHVGGLTRQPPALRQQKQRMAGHL